MWPRTSDLIGDPAFFTGQVLIPNMLYSGQVPISEVSRNTPPNTSRMMPRVPETVPVKYNTAKTIARAMRITLSMVPTLVFMC